MDQNILSNPFFTSGTPAPAMYPWLDHDEECDVAIVGNGIAGAFCAYKFAKAGISTVILGDNPAGYGTTSSSPGVISCQLEGGILGLSRKIGMDEAVSVYKMCEKSVGDIQTICSELSKDVGFSRRSALYYTSSEKSIQSMHDEYLVRKHNEFDVDFVKEENAANLFSFPLKAGIYSPELSAEVDPYALTCALLEKAEAFGASVFENTAVIMLEDAKDFVTLQTSLGKTITAKKVIMAAGSESARQLGLLSDVRTSFTTVTAPVADFSGWHERCLIASAERADIKLRTTPDNRIIISGLSCGISQKLKKTNIMPVEALKAKKFKELSDILTELFPAIHDITPEYNFASDYIRTIDSLPVGGPLENSGIYCCLCTGENGIAFASILSDLLLDVYNGSPSEDLALFSPLR